MSNLELKALLSTDVVVEEKVDGANLGMSLDSEGQLRPQNRGQFLTTPLSGQFERLPQWLALHGDRLKAAMSLDLIVFGEWCAARHTLRYHHLPDWWLFFDVYDRARASFLPLAARNALARRAGVVAVAEVFRGRATVDSLQHLLMTTQSRYRDGPIEGLVVRNLNSATSTDRAKLVRPDFTQAIDSHWRRRRIEWNRMSTTAPLNTK